MPEKVKPPAMRVAIYYRKGKRKGGTRGITPLLFSYTAKFTKFMQ